LKSWDKQGAQIVTHDGEFNVGYQDIKGLGVHPDVAAEQPDVMAAGATKAAGPATPQEDRPVTPTKYALDDFAVGQHVTGQGHDGATVTYTGTVKDPDVNGMVRVELDEPLESGATAVLLYPHEITAIDEPEEEKGATKTAPSDVPSAGGKGEAVDSGDSEKAGKAGADLEGDGQGPRLRDRHHHGGVRRRVHKIKAAATKQDQHEQPDLEATGRRRRGLGGLRGPHPGQLLRTRAFASQISPPSADARPARSRYAPVHFPPTAPASRHRGSKLAPGWCRVRPLGRGGRLARSPG
jgi:hypothetical protein